MAKARFGYTNLALTSTITASTSVPNRPASFLQSAARWKKWRSATGTGDQSVTFDFGIAKTVRLVALVDWKVQAGGRIEAYYWNGAAYVLINIFTLPTFNPTRVVALWHAGPVTSRILIYFRNLAGANDYAELGVAYAGDYYQPTYTIIDGFRIEPIDPSEERASVDGQVETQRRTPYHSIAGTFETEPEADFVEFRRMFDAIGRHTPLVLAVDPDDPAEIFYAKLQQLPVQHDFGDFWTLQVSAREER